MGRPVGKRFFGTTVGGASLAGGEGVASLAVNGANSYSAGTTIGFSASPIGGTTTEASVTFVTPADGAPGNGNVASYSITTAGTGYITAPTVTFTKPANVVTTGTTYNGGSNKIVTVGSTTGLYVGMVANVGFGTLTSGNPTRIVAIYTANANVIMSNANTAALSGAPISFGDVGFGGAITATLNPAVTTGNTIQANAWVGTTESKGNIADIVSQKGARRYRVTNSVTTGVCRLVANAAVVAAGGPLSAGEMTITATESTGATYFVVKLDSRTATVWQGTGTQFANLAQVPWTMNTAVANVSVKISTNN